MKGILGILGILLAVGARAETNAVQALSAQWEEAKAMMTAPVENLTLPAQYHDNGRVKVMLHAKQAQMLGLDVIFARDMHLDLFDDKGIREGTMDMDDCLFNRKSGEGYCRGRVRIDYGHDKLAGRGVYFKVSQDKAMQGLAKAQLLSECEIRTQRMPKKLGI